jgi:hypothetical protein
MPPSTPPHLKKGDKKAAFPTAYRQCGNIMRAALTG